MAAIASFLQTVEFFGLGPDYDARLPDLHSGGDSRRVNAAAREFCSQTRPRSSWRAVPRPWSAGEPLVSTKAVFFDVDFTLIYPGPTFQGEGYSVLRQHGILVDPARFDAAVAGASVLLDEAQESSTIPRSSFTTRGRSSRAWAARVRPRCLRARDLRGMGRVPALRAL